MVDFLAENWVWLVIALIVGVVTAWWAWSQPDIVHDEYADDAADDTIADSDVKLNDSSQSIAGMASGFAASAGDSVGTVATGTADIAKKAADTTVSTAKSATNKVASTAKDVVKPAKEIVEETAQNPVKTAKASTKASANAAPKKASATTKKAAAPKKAVSKEVSSKAAPPKKATPKRAEPKKAAAEPVIPNDLELLKGVGPKLNGLLKSLGVTTFDQVANWKAADISDVDSKLGSFAGRITRDNWVDQAKLLSKGDVKGFEKKYGSLGKEIKR